MLFVFDTNTLISALLKPESIPANSLTHALKKGILIFSAETEHEYLEVAAREKFNKYLPFAQRLNNVHQLLNKAQLKMVTLRLPESCKDNEDIKFLELALEWKANAIVSGDRHFLMLHPFEGIPILSPVDFLKKF